MNTSIIFLDIDGPMIPARAYLRPDDDDDGKGFNKTPFDPIAANILRRLCERFDPCKIVTNTSWNTIPERLLAKMEEAGLVEHTFIHAKGVRSGTEYPRIPNRLIAIETWIGEHGHIVGKEPNWVAFDDQPIMHERAIAINPDDGILYMDYDKATVILGDHDRIMILV